MISRNRTKQNKSDGAGQSAAEHSQIGDPETRDREMRLAGPPDIESSGSANGQPAENEVCGRISDFLQPSQIALDLDTSSRKRLFEFLSELAASGAGEISTDEVFKILTERERIGCTGLGHGIAVPHGRIENLSQPVVALARLKHPIDYDAPDDRPVWLAVGLLVPAEANDTHLKLLSKLASCFQNDTFVAELRACQSADAVIALFDECE